MRVTPWSRAFFLQLLVGTGSKTHWNLILWRFQGMGCGELECELGNLR